MIVNGHKVTVYSSISRGKNLFSVTLVSITGGNGQWDSRLVEQIQIANSSALCNVLTWVSNAYNQKFAEDVGHHLNGGLADHMAMAADQMDGGREEARAGARCLHADLLVLAA